MSEYGISDFCFAGGVALNCTANARMIRDLGINSHIHPAAGDAGGALGAALQWTTRSREHEAARRYPLDAYLGGDYPEPVITATLPLHKIPCRECPDTAEQLTTALAPSK